MLLLYQSLLYATEVQPIDNYEYSSYVQIDKSTTKGKYFFLVMLKHNDYKKNNDISMANFVLAPGEKQREEVFNKYYPEKKYIFNVEVTKDGRIMGKIRYEVLDNEKPIFKAMQEYAISPNLSF